MASTFTFPPSFERGDEAPMDFTYNKDRTDPSNPFLVTGEPPRKRPFSLANQPAPETPRNRPVFGSAFLFSPPPKTDENRSTIDPLEELGAAASIS
ncbi:hypothetical protein IWQ62_002344, partial [Dispira parvispora]